MDYMEIANSAPMWIAASLAVLLVLFQAILFAKKSYTTGKEIGLEKSQMKSAMKSSFITSIGPSIVILTGLLSLLVTVGGPMAWMRLSFIGSVGFELMAVGHGTEAVGIRAGIDPMTNIAFANAVWTMITGSIGWIIFATLSADKMETVQEKFSKGNVALLSVISVAAMQGSFASLVSDHIVAMNKNTVAAILGGLIMLILLPIANKKNIKWLKEWTLAISIFGGTLVTALL